MFLSLWFCFLNAVASERTIDTLPGFSGRLPFDLETGYVGVRNSEELQLFYYFVESEKEPTNDPLIFWFTGGPGCSCFSAVANEIGPITYDLPSSHGGYPSFILNPYSWTKFANILFIDSPVGTGFSYATTSRGYHSSTTQSVVDAADFLRKWLVAHPKFIKNPLYVGGDSYAGIFVPMVVLELLNGNDAGCVPNVNLKGYLLGNPLTDADNEVNSRIKYAHNMALISDEDYKAVRSSCNGEYINLNPENALCNKYIKLVTEYTEKINVRNILEKCLDEPTPNNPGWSVQELKPVSNHIRLPTSLWEINCWYVIDDLSVAWANDPRVREALHVRKGTKPFWKRCNTSLDMDQNESNVVPFHRALSGKQLRALVYSGDHDMLVPYFATRGWIRSLNCTTEERWRAWFAGGQIAGFTEKYKKNDYDLTFATIKGGGHVAVEFNPFECFVMAERWFSGSAL